VVTMAGTPPDLPLCSEKTWRPRHSSGLIDPQMGASGRFLHLGVRRSAAEQRPAPSAQEASQLSAPSKLLQIVILDGQGALNNIKLRTAHEPSCRCRTKTISRSLVHSCCSSCLTPALAEHS
jgi:hypothetical protein